MLPDISCAWIPSDNSLNLLSSLNSWIRAGRRRSWDSYHRTRDWRVFRSRVTCEYSAAKRLFLTFSSPNNAKAPIRARPKDTPTPIPTPIIFVLSESCSAVRAVLALEIEAHLEPLLIFLDVAVLEPREVDVLAALDDMVLGNALLDNAGLEVEALELELSEADAAL